jgi:hypothetical protein
LLLKVRQSSLFLLPPISKLAVLLDLSDNNRK